MRFHAIRVVITIIKNQSSENLMKKLLDSTSSRYFKNPKSMDLTNNFLKIYCKRTNSN
jgi:hypothetical protein